MGGRGEERASKRERERDQSVWNLFVDSFRRYAPPFTDAALLEMKKDGVQRYATYCSQKHNI